MPHDHNIIWLEIDYEVLSQRLRIFQNRCIWCQLVICKTEVRVAVKYVLIMIFKKAKLSIVDGVGHFWYNFVIDEIICSYNIIVEGTIHALYN